MIDLVGDVTDNGISKLVFTILSAVAEAERDRIRERISTVKADQKARGSYLGGKVPYGYELVGEGRDKRLVRVAGQQEVISSIQEMRLEGKPLRAIQAALGDRLSLEAINRICREMATWPASRFQRGVDDAANGPASRFERQVDELKRNEALHPRLALAKVGRENG